MVIYLVTAIIILVSVTVTLMVLVVSMRSAKRKKNAGSIILNGGKSVNSEVRQPNMGNGLLSDPTSGTMETILTGQIRAGKRNHLVLTDCENGTVYTIVFRDYVEIGSIPDPTVPKLVIAISGISRSHCRIRAGVSGYRVEDCKSTNHTWLNGNIVTSSCEIRTGDTLCLAGRSFHVSIQVEG